MTSQRLVFVSAIASIVLASCGGGGSSIVSEAQEKSDATCACTEFDCTMEYIAWFNKVGVTQEDDLDELSAQDRATFDEVRSAAADCQNELR